MPPIQVGRPMLLWEMLWSSGGRNGRLTVWAPDAETAQATVEAHPSSFGIPYADPIIGLPWRIPYRELKLGV